MKKLAIQTLSELVDFDEVVDVRSPAEFAEDHLPGAINLPVLNDDERAEVGTQYKHDDFAGRARGAALISGRIAQHLHTHFNGKDRSYRPLIYCWRGGQRSQSLATVLSAVGWRVSLLQGGYKAFRKLVMRETAEKCANLEFRVISGLTGAGKSRLLRHMEAAGHQVLDLEYLAAHRGSLLGDEPDQPQPGQKAFETAIGAALQRFSPEKPVWVESESRRVGRLFCPDALWEKMTTAPVMELVTPRVERARMLLEDYHHFPKAPDQLLQKLSYLTVAHGHERVGFWCDLVKKAAWLEFTESLLEAHYDPAYLRAGKYPSPAFHVELAKGDAHGLEAARQAVAEWGEATLPYLPAEIQLTRCYPAR